MSIGRAAAAALLSGVLVVTACNQGAPTSSAGASAMPHGIGGASHPAPWAGFIDLSGEAYSLPSGIAFQGQSVWVSNYVNGGHGPRVPIIYRYDLRTGRSTGSIPSPSDWTTCVGFDGSALLVIDSTDTTRLFRVSPQTGAVLSSFVIPWSAGFSGAWDGAHLYLADYVAMESGPTTHISKYSASGEALGVIHVRTGAWDATGQPRDGIAGLAYGDGTLWALVSPRSAGAPYRLLSLSVEGAELSIVDIPDSAGRSLDALAYDGSSFWTLEQGPMSIADFSYGKWLVPFKRPAN